MQGWMTLSLRLTLLYLLFFGLFTFGAGQPALTRVWDFAMLEGLSAFLALLTLFILTGRPLRKPFYEGKFFMRLHICLGYLACLLLAVHITSCIWSEPLLWQDLYPPTLPLMQTGLIATVLLLVMLCTSHSRIRNTLFRNARTFRRIHYGLAAVLLCAAAFHIWQADFRISGRMLSALLALSTLMVLASPIGKRALPDRASVSQNRRIRQTAALALPTIAVLSIAGVATPLLCAWWLNR